MNFLLDVWREASQQPELEDAVDRIARLMSSHVPADAMLVRALDYQHSQIQTVAAGLSRAGSPMPRSSTPCTPEEFNQVLAWCRREQVAGASGDDRSGVMKLLAPADVRGEWLAGPLMREGHPIGVMLLLSRGLRSFEPRHHPMVEAILEPVSVALANNFRHHELARLREAVEAENRALLSRLDRDAVSDTIVGSDAGLKSVMERIDQVAPTDAPVLILGETGSGKEVLARAIHSRSKRADGPVVRVNCGALPPGLIDSELFGHERGSFTGADRMHRGYYERANRGTLFLDEITEMPAELQVKLLRVLETGKVTRIGGNESFSADVRVIAATNRKPEEAVAKGKLRDDLLYRLNVFPIALPPLRDRREDVDLLAEHFLALLNKEHDTSKEFTRPALNRLRSHHWPGNVRELRNLVHRAFILAEDHIGLDCLPLGVQESAGSSLALKVGTSLGEAERRLILATLEECEGDKKKAAEVLGISLKTLYNRLNEYKSA